MDEPREISSYNFRPMCTPVRMTPSKTDQTAKKIEESKWTITNPNEAHKMDINDLPWIKTERAKMEEPRDISSNNFHPMCTPVRMTPSKTDQAAKKIEESKCTITNPNEDHKMDFNDLPWSKTERAKMEEPREISSNNFHPMCIPVRMTPSKTDQVAKKIEESKCTITNPNEDHKMDFNDLTWIKTERAKMEEPREISSNNFHPMCTPVRMTPSKTDQAAKKIEERKCTITNPNEDHKMDFNDLPWIKTERAKMEEPREINSNNFHPMCTPVRMTPSKTDQAAKKIEERKCTITNPNEDHKMDFNDLPWIKTERAKMEEPREINSNNFHPMCTPVRMTPSKTDQAAKKIEERKCTITNPNEDHKMDFNDLPWIKTERAKMEEPREISNNNFHPMCTPVRMTPSKTDQAAKKIEERKCTITNPNEDHKMDFNDLPWIKTERAKMDVPREISSYNFRPMHPPVRMTPSKTDQEAKKIEEIKCTITNPNEDHKMDIKPVRAKMDESHEINSYNFRPMATPVRTTPSKTDQAAKKIEESETTITNPNEEHKMDINDLPWIKTVRAKINSVHPQPRPSRPCTIFRVPEYIRGGDSTAYEPLVVSIGPYHSRRTQQGTCVAMQEHKWKCVRHLLSRHRSQEKATDLLDRCLSQLKALDCEVRSCYSTKLNLDQHKLASLMLLDGCFIIHTLLKQVQNGNETVVTVEERRAEKVNANGEEEQTVDLDIGDEEEDIEAPLMGMLWIHNLIVYDLLKLENQIPFFIIQILFDILKTPADLGVDLANLALILFRDIHPNEPRIFPELPRKEIHHLLHLFHSTLIPSSSRAFACAQPVDVTTSPEWIPCASELKLGGIKFKKNEAAQSFLDVSFNDGLMEIPPLRIYDYTPALFRNLIAFEQCYPDTRTYVTIYAAFMDCIVDTADDVHLLGLEGILVNRLGTDEAVANLFNRLCDQIHYASDMNYLEDVFISVTNYHESKWHMWRAGLIRDYFSSPWSGIAVVAAVVLFLLTVQQSWLAYISYFYPP